MGGPGVIAGAIGVRSVFALAGLIAIGAGVVTVAVFRGVALPEPADTAIPEPVSA